MTLLLCMCAGAWATVVKVGRTLEFSSTPTDYTILSVTNATTTKSDGAGAKTGTKKKVKNNSTEVTINAPCYRSIQSDNSTALLSYQPTSYLGFQTVIADGYRLGVTSIAAKVAVNQTFTYKIQIVDAGGNVVYESLDKTGAVNNANNPSITPSGLYLAGTVSVRMYYYNSGNEDKSKYIVPLDFSITGNLEAASSYTLTTSVSGDGTVTGAGTYVDGTKATLTATPGSSVFTKWQKDGADFDGNTVNPIQVAVTADATYTAVFTAATTHTITAAYAVGQDSDWGTITNLGDNNVVEDETITLEATPKEGYAFIKWTKGGADYSTDASITITSTTDETYVANFYKLYKVTYSVGSFEKGTQTSYQNGTLTKYANASDQMTMPKNYAFVYSSDFAEAVGYTLKYWNNGGSNYTAGGNYTMTADLTAMAPVFEANSVSLADDLSESQTVTWNFASNASAPDVHVEGKTGYYVVQTTINGTSIDVPMYITGAKFNMGSTRAQVNANTNFMVPAVKGMTVTYTADSGSPAVDQFSTDDDTNVEVSVSSKVVTIIYNGTNSSLTITDKNGGYWPKKLTVTYPASTAAVSTLTGRNYASYVTTQKLDFSSAEGITAYIATGLNGASDAVVIESVDVVPAGTPIIVKTDTKGATVNVPVTTASASDVSGNKLVAGDGSTSYSAGTYYYLASDLFHLATSGTLQSGKAYLQIPSPARQLGIVFGDETTGIHSIDNGKLTIDNDVYDLRGQRVAQPKKGLYIVNGKKVVIK